jgi:hypothetical protein
MNKSKISFYFIFISFFTFLAILLTIIQSSYTNLVNPTKQVEADKFLEPLNPALDSEIIQEIEKRQELQEGDIIIINSDSNRDNIISPTSTVISVTPTPNINNQTPNSPIDETN